MVNALELHLTKKSGNEIYGKSVDDDLSISCCENFAKFATTRK